jgi:hypothetical protein
LRVPGNSDWLLPFNKLLARHRWYRCCSYNHSSFLQPCCVCCTEMANSFHGRRNERARIKQRRHALAHARWKWALIVCDNANALHLLCRSAICKLSNSKQKRYLFDNRRMANPHFSPLLWREFLPLLVPVLWHPWYDSFDISQPAWEKIN